MSHPSEPFTCKWPITNTSKTDQELLDAATISLRDYLADHWQVATDSPVWAFKDHYLHASVTVRDLTTRELTPAQLHQAQKEPAA